MVFLLMNEFLTKDDIHKIADLHQRSLGSGFVTSLGGDFLVMLYTHIYCCKDSTIIVVRADGEIIGFVSGFISIRQIYISMLSNPIRLLLALFPNLFKLNIIKRIIKVILSKKNIYDNEFSGTSAELYSICVAEKYRNMHYGKYLFEAICEYFEEANQKSFKIKVGKDLVGAQNFYLRQGAELVFGFGQGVSNQSIIYEKKILSKDLLT